MSDSNIRIPAHDAEPLVPLTRTVERRLIDDLLPGRQTDGLSVRAQWSQADGVPAVLGCWWYAGFDTPEATRRWFGLARSEYWIGRGAFGRVRGGHAICIYGASDQRQAFALCNSWGLRYPLVWVPYETMQHLLDEDGEATVIVDRPAVPKGEA